MNRIIIVKQSIPMSPRPGTDVASDFFNNCNSAEDWQRILNENYDDAIQAMSTKKKNPSLRSMDNFWRDDFAPLVKEKGHFTLAELSRIMAWKLARGKFRPLQKLCDSNSPDAVVLASTEALEALTRRDWKGAMKKLTTLKAVGEATASALLAPLAPDLCPFMTDEALEVTYGARDYTAKAYAVLREQLVDKATQLGMQAEQVGRVIWVVATLAACGQPVSYTSGSRVGPAAINTASTSKKRPAAGTTSSSGKGKTSSPSADGADGATSSGADKRAGDVAPDEPVRQKRSKA